MINVYGVTIANNRLRFNEFDYFGFRETVDAALFIHDHFVHAQ